MKQQKRRKRSRVSKGGVSGNQSTQSQIADVEKQNILKNLMEAFASASLEEVTSAYNEAGCDPDKAAEMLVKVGESAMQEDTSTIGSSSSNGDSAGSLSSRGNSSSSSGNSKMGSSSGSNDSVMESSSSSNEPAGVFGDEYFWGSGFKNKSKQKGKKVIAAAGTVSTVLGKDYVRSTPKMVSSRSKGVREENWKVEEAEKFLCSMLGEDSELGLAVVSDVLCECGYDLDKALNILLELSSSSSEQASGSSNAAATSSEDSQFFLDSHDSQTDRTSDSTSRSSGTEYQDNVWFTGNPFSGLSKASGSSESVKAGKLESDLPQKVLESLFNMPTPSTVEHEPNTMNWRNVVKQMVSLGPRSEDCTIEALAPIAKEEEYQVLRTSARQHWDSMKTYYQKATTAFSNGDRHYAAYLSEQGRAQNKMAREADEKASRDIFTSRNRGIENMITIDLHGQHLKQAMRLLKLHLLFGAYVRSVRLFRVITGCGSNGIGKSKLKISVVDLLKKEGIEWSEENRGTLIVKLKGQTAFTFLDSVSDEE